VDVVAGYRAHDLVASHPDVPVDTPDRDAEAEFAESAIPGQRVLVIAVDERPVDVDDRGVDSWVGHWLTLPFPVVGRRQGCVTQPPGVKRRAADPPNRPPPSPRRH